MKINSSNQNIQQLYQSQTERTGQGHESSGASANRTADRKDSVEVSNHAQLLQKAAQEVDRKEVGRSERIAKLQEQVRGDTYQVPVQQLATRMMSELF